MAVESDGVIFGLPSIPFLIIPNIWYAFFLVAWPDVFVQGSLSGIVSSEPIIL